MKIRMVKTERFSGYRAYWMDFDLQEFMNEQYPRKSHKWEDLELAKEKFKKWVTPQRMARLFQDEDDTNGPLTPDKERDYTDEETYEAITFNQHGGVKEI